ncbi:MAG: FliM/FliN family flagellar motor switch protein [Rhodospirillaceae bacterium]|nr:FliM/FliN family flagellar motor switch protein [Rhodospirillaceae bacterium]MBL6941599.1 FliM/FliN family flagellar motor switch protein [Rhodospirillales bacterium]
MPEEDEMDMAAAMAEGMADEDDVDTVGAVYGISVDVTAVLGTALMPISQILKLGRGAVVELERLVGEEIELVAEENIIAKGEVIVIEDRLGVSITKIVKRM